MIPFFADITLIVLSVILIIAARAKVEKGALHGVAVLASLLVIMVGFADENSKYSRRAIVKEGLEWGGK